MLYFSFPEYKFLDFPPEDLETPYSLPHKPAAGKKQPAPLNFNFKKVFQVDAESNYHRRQLLASMIVASGDDEDEGAFSDEIPFTIVSEPNDEDDEDEDEKAEAPSGDECEDLGCASVRLSDILTAGKDLVDEELPVYGSGGGGGGERTKPVVGHLKVSVECLATLKKVKAEMDAATTLASSSLLDENTVDKTKSLVQ